MEKYSPLVLAFLGDASYSLYVRRFVIDRQVKVNDMQHHATRYVSATAQSGFVHYFLEHDILTPQEVEIYKQGRNAHAHAAPRNASAVDYHCATGFEAVWGWWEVNGNTARMAQIWDIIRTIQGE
jgi:ribonuclease-3 family protein